jgi:hypothetical protein
MLSQEQLKQLKQNESNFNVTTIMEYLMNISYIHLQLLITLSIPS